MCQGREDEADPVPAVTAPSKERRHKPEKYQKQTTGVGCCVARRLEFLLLSGQGRPLRAGLLAEVDREPDFGGRGRLSGQKNSQCKGCAVERSLLRRVEK